VDAGAVGELSAPVLIRRETPPDADAVAAVTTAAFRTPGGGAPVETRLLSELRRDEAWLPALSLVAADADGVIGHVVCTRAHVETAPALGLGPLSVLPERQHQGVGTALMHAVLGAADALGEPVVVLLGDPGYYRRFGFRLAAEYAIEPPVAAWSAHFQARPLGAWDPAIRGRFAYAAPFSRV
jgi:putative acetyltransferase